MFFFNFLITGSYCFIIFVKSSIAFKYINFKLKKFRQIFKKTFKKKIIPASLYKNIRVKYAVITTFILGTEEEHIPVPCALNDEKV